MDILHEFVMGRGPIEDLLVCRKAALACKELFNNTAAIFIVLGAGALVVWDITGSGLILSIAWFAMSGLCELVRWYYHKMALSYVKQLEQLGLGALLLILLRKY